MAFRRILHVFRDIIFFCSSRLYFDLVELELLILFTALLAVVQFQSVSGQPVTSVDLKTYGISRLIFEISSRNFIVIITVSTIYAHGDSCNSYENNIEIKGKSLSTPKCV